jgi:hypothetical protein
MQIYAIDLGFRGFCPHGKPLIEKGKPQICGIDTACPKDYLCHVTNKESKSICCMDPGKPFISIMNHFNQSERKFFSIILSIAS